MKHLIHNLNTIMGGVAIILFIILHFLYHKCLEKKENE